MTTYACTLADVRAAAERIDGHAHITPVMTSSTLDDLAGRSLFFKCELFQKVGAFKFRGAMNAIASLPPAKRQRGVVTHSSGNHGQAVALAARVLNTKATIVMPSNAPAVKRQAVEDYGARVITCEPTSAARSAAAEAFRAKTGATFIHPSNDPDVIAGQGTIALELLSQVDDLDALIVPVGGGGMLSGITLAARELKPGIRIFAAEPLGADDAARSKAAGQLIPQTAPDTVADGLRTSLGENTWPIVRDLVEEVIVVEEDAILQATRMIWERMKLVIEPSAGVGVAVALSDHFRALQGIDRVGVVLCGGNVDLDRLPWM